ncbi:MAG: GAF domain-containing protein [Planctomycetota bacterium]
MADATTLLKQLEETLAGDAAEPYSVVLRLLLDHFDCVVGTVHRMDDASGLLQLVAEQGIPAAIRQQVERIPIGKGMAGLAAERKEPVQVCNLQTDTSGDVRPGAKMTKMEGSIAVPILSGQALRGTFGIAKPTAYEFSSSEITTLNGAAQLLARHL